MQNRLWSIIIGTMLVLSVCHAQTETNGLDNVAAEETSAVEGEVVPEEVVVDEMTAESTVAEETEIPVEESVAAPEKRDKWDFLIGVGLVASPGYGDYIDDAYAGYTDLDDVGGWVDLYVGLEYRPVSRFGILVGGDIWLNGGIDASGGGALDESYANAIFIPSVYGQLYLTKSGWLYINGGVNFPIPETGSDYFEFNDDGIGYGANIGVELANVIRIEGGYVYVPINVEATPSNPVLTGEKDYDFGGAQLRIILAF